MVVCVRALSPCQWDQESGLSFPNQCSWQTPREQCRWGLRPLTSKRHSCNVKVLYVAIQCFQIRDGYIIRENVLWLYRSCNNSNSTIFSHGTCVFKKLSYVVFISFDPQDYLSLVAKETEFRGNFAHSMLGLDSKPGSRCVIGGSPLSSLRRNLLGMRFPCC